MGVDKRAFVLHLTEVSPYAVLDGSLTLCRGKCKLQIVLQLCAGSVQQRQVTAVLPVALSFWCKCTSLRSIVSVLEITFSLICRDVF